MVQFLRKEHFFSYSINSLSLVKSRTLAKDKKVEVNSISVSIIKPDGMIPPTVTAFGRIALTSRGMEQTGLSSTSEIEFEYKKAPATSHK
ncbi:hypothetical protein EMIT07CA2_20195 [Brevibacillus sp. IT-7CA2]